VALANGGSLTWVDLARRVAESARLPCHGVEACSSRDLGLRAPRPAYSALGSERGWLLATLDDALARYFDERDAAAPDLAEVQVRARSRRG
jgi:dTDP-4-dehydrorhamnose reductase